jgi:HEAT repeat protein
VPGATTGGRPTISDGTSWQVWWEFAKDPLIGTAPANLGPVTGSDEYYLGARRRNAAHDVEAVQDADRRDRIAAALHKALQGEKGRDLVTACLVALAKVGMDPPNARLVDVLSAQIGDNDQEIRETAVLALGIAGRQEALPTLAALLQQTAEGRKLVGNADVSVRTRAFAVWSLGLLASRSADLSLKQRVHDLLLPVLQDKDESSRDLRVAAIQGLGLLASAGDRPAGERRIVWQTTAELWDYYRKDLGKGDQLVQAHVPTAVVRLLGRGVSAEHQRAKALLAEELTSGKRRHNTIYQSAAMALGLLCLPAEQSSEDAPFAQALLHCYQRGTDQLARFHAALALGRIGGESNRKALLSIYGDANRTLERPWVALALGLLAREKVRSGGVVDAEIGKLLLADFTSADFDDAEAAYALSLGLCGYVEAAPAIELKFVRRGRSDILEGYLAIAMALLEHVAATEVMTVRMEGAVRRPFVLQQCAIALGRLGDVRAVPRLVGMLAECESAASLAAVAQGLGQIGDRRSIDPLVAALLDTKSTKLARAFAAAALGSVGDKDTYPWNARIAADTNYMATVDTLTNGATGVLDIL